MISMILQRILVSSDDFLYHLSRFLVIDDVGVLFVEKSNMRLLLVLGSSRVQVRAGGALLRVLQL